MDRNTFHQARQGGVWQLIAILFCTLFGFAHLLNVFTVGDGLWYWYAVLFQRGEHLYADLHLNQQPLFILLTDAALHLFGSSWIGIHVFPAIQVVLYSVGLALVARFAPWKGRDRALLVLAAFGMTMDISYYRFDDYHVTTQILQVYSLWLLLRLDRDATVRRSVVVAIPLAVLAGLSLSNRLNDGAALVIASGLALFGISVRNRVYPLVVYAFTVMSTFASCILLTGDSWRTWFLYSVVLAAKIKGGSGHIWLYPIALPVRVVWGFLKSPHSFLPAIYTLCVVVGAMWWLHLRVRHNAMRRRGWLIGTSLFLLVSSFYFLRGVYLGNVNYTIANLGVPAAYLLFGVLAFRFWKAMFRPGVQEHWHGRELLLLIPALQLFLAAMTAGAGLTETTPAMAITLLILPVITPAPLTGRLRRGLILLTGLIAFAAFPFKYLNPFAWHAFFSDVMFVNRSWYQHPKYGPMYVDNRNLGLMEPICQKIAAEPGDLLSMPYPHANYFCAVSPWKGYVQTWYDTTSKETIDQLVQELTTRPPLWIFYERNIGTMQGHETVYNGGKPIPHRKLDKIIMNRLNAMQWSVQKEQCLAGADWMLIRTTPFRPGETPTLPVMMSDTSNFCGRTRIPQ